MQKQATIHILCNCVHQLTRRAHTLLVALFVLCNSSTVWAVWNERIELLADAPPPAGTTAVFQLPNGQAIEGQVEQDDDRLFIVFVLPGDGPSAGTLTFAGQSYTVPVRASDQRLTLNLDTAQLAVAGQNSSPLRWGATDGRRIFVEVEAFYAVVESDHLENQLDKSAEEVVTSVLEPTGATGIGATTSADDDDSGAGAALTIRWMTAGPWGYYATVSHLELDDFNGAVTGTGLVPPAFNLEATSVAQSELRINQLIIGASYDIEAWRFFFGAGVVQVRLKDDFVTRLLVNDMVVESLEGSSGKREHGTVIEVGLQRQLGKHAYVIARLQSSVDAIDNQTQAQIGIGARF
ncbi:MAG: hypothetical protein AAF993_00380 [Pseudomonadota bacterium]